MGFCDELAFGAQRDGDEQDRWAVPTRKEAGRGVERR